MNDARPAADTFTDGQMIEQRREARQDADRTVILMFTLTSFVSALLLFLIQPLFAKMVLPVLGGSPSVWAVALCFFQGALLAGYCYTFLLNRFVPVRWSGAVHAALYLAALLVLPVGLPAGWGEPPTGEPYLWQLGLFAVAIGLPFVAVAANAPLLQAWFVSTGHPAGRDPYFLYAASNLGSLLALLSYPFVLEPVFGLKALSVVWTFGFVILALALAACFAFVLRGYSAPAGELPRTEPIPAVSWSQRAGWVWLALIPSALLTAFTAHVSTDVASAPLLWVLPLSLYLLTFVLVFRERPLVPPQIVLWVHLFAVLGALVFLAQTKHDGWVESSIFGVVAFASSALVAHRTLYEQRPPAQNLTEFYLWLSLGGVLGGLFAALAAPKLFSEIYEYPLILALTMTCRPGVFRMPRRISDILLLPLVAATGAFVILQAPSALAASGVPIGDWGAAAAITLGFGILALLTWHHPMAQSVLALLMCATVVLLPSSVKRGEAQRSYFGVYRVAQSDDGQFNVLTHGTTLHGAQRIRDGDGNTVAETTPGTYYYPDSPMANAIGVVRSAVAARGAQGRFGVIGLGAGSLACLSRPEETWRFFEIDPVMVDIARYSNNFTYLVNCQPNTDIVIGDARLTMAKQADEAFDLIIVDAFTSDAVPVHLMTAEALQLYMSKLSQTGVAVLHISNRYLDLDGVLGATLNGLRGVHGLLVSDDDADGSYNQSSSTIAVFTKSQETLDGFRLLKGVSEFDRESLKPWTDDNSDILGPLWAKIAR